MDIFSKHTGNKEARDNLSRASIKGSGCTRQTLVNAVCLSLGVAALIALVIAVASIMLGPNGIVGSRSDSSANSTEVAPAPETATQMKIDSYPDNVVAWVSVPDTNIDCPVVLGSPDDPTYYLSHDAWGSYDIYGTPYVSCLSDKGLQSLNVIIYGHHMSDGTIFADFACMSSERYAEEHSIIDFYVRSDGHTHKLHVVGVNAIDADEEGPVTEFADSLALSTYLKQKLSESEVVLQDFVTASRLYTFVTCSYDTSNGRTLVYAIEEGGV